MDVIMKKRRYQVTAMAMAVMMAAASFNVSNTGAVVYAAEEAAKSDEVHFPEVYTQDLVVPEKDEAVVEKKVNALLKSMTTEEKFTFLGGSGTGDEGNAGDLPGVPRLGVPRIKNILR